MLNSTHECNQRDGKVIDTVLGTVTAMSHCLFRPNNGERNSISMSPDFASTYGNGFVQYRLWRRRKRQILLRIFRFYTFSAICLFISCDTLSVDAALSEGGRSKLDSASSNTISTNATSHINLQFSSSDIVAQFNLPEGALGNSDGSSESVTTSTITLNSLNRSLPNTMSGSQSRNYFTHLTYDFKRKVFYAGATNKILQLNENLRVLSQALTGPKYDSPQCHASGCPQDVETTLVDNHNKILIVNYMEGVGILIVCGSVRQGNCVYINIHRFFI